MEFPSVEVWKKQIIEGDRKALSKAITLLESSLTEHEKLADELFSAIEGKSTDSLRIAVSGSPGVGKSTFIEAFGSYLIEKGKKVAVLSIDPSSTLTHGSILGDKTRMERLSKNPNAYIRPSASGGKLGGVTHKTKELITLCESAGYDIILIETVGVGQSEIEAHSMTDLFLMLVLPNSGDSLQGIKKGIVEMADILVVNKADGEHIKAAKKTLRHYKEALHLFPAGDGWSKRCLSVSSLESIGIEELWKAILKYKEIVNHSGDFEKKRLEQEVKWFEKSAIERTIKLLNSISGIMTLKDHYKEEIKHGNLSARDASNTIIEKLKNLLKL